MVSGDCEPAQFTEAGPSPDWAHRAGPGRGAQRQRRADRTCPGPAAALGSPAPSQGKATVGRRVLGSLSTAPAFPGGWKRWGQEKVAGGVEVGGIARGGWGEKGGGGGGGARGGARRGTTQARPAGDPRAPWAPPRGAGGARCARLGHRESRCRGGGGRGWGRRGKPAWREPAPGTRGWGGGAGPGPRAPPTCAALPAAPGPPVLCPRSVERGDAVPFPFLLRGWRPSVSARTRR